MSQVDLARMLRGTADGPRPAFSAAGVVALVDERPVASVAYGAEARFADADGLQEVDGAPVTEHTRFDLASVTKLFTAAVLLEELADAGLGLDTPVGEVLDAYRRPGRSQIRFRHLLTHTAGLPAVWTGWRASSSAEHARAEVLELGPAEQPGAVHRYSCIGYIHAGIAAEAVSGLPLDELLRVRVTGPLGMDETGYRPAADAPVAATEWQDHPVRGITRGAVHDETARALGGVSGNAGVFGTAADLARFGEELRTGERGVLRPETRELMTRRAVPAALTPDYGQAAGPRLDGVALLGPLADGAFWHTGFTGTLLFVHPARRLTVAALTNSVHPSRDRADLGRLRRDLLQSIGDAA